MERSGLTKMFAQDAEARFMKKYKESYKKETGEELGTNVMKHLMLSSIMDDGIPDINHTIKLMSLGNSVSEEVAAEKIAGALKLPEYKERGLLGIHCDLCKDHCIDIPFNKEFTEFIFSMEESILAKVHTKYEIAKMASKFEKLLGELKVKADELENKEVDTKEVDTQEEDEAENKEVGTQEEVK